MADSKTLDGTGIPIGSTGNALDVNLKSGSVAVGPNSSSGNAPTQVTVGVTSAQAVASNASRKGLILRNISTSSQVISLGFSGNAAVANDGVVLNPNDVYCMGSFDFSTGQVNAIASAASATLSVQEFQ